jgi:hypothetical protein
MDNPPLHWTALVKRNKSLLILAIGLGIAVACPAVANVLRNPTQDYSYDHLALLRVFRDGPVQRACFRTSDGTVTWVSRMEKVGNQFGYLRMVYADRIQIEQLQSVNDGDWISIKFYWPVATGKAARYAKKCGQNKGAGPN